jgi:hypothetical protein
MSERVIISLTFIIPISPMKLKTMKFIKPETTKRGNNYELISRRGLVNSVEFMA